MSSNQPDSPWSSTTFLNLRPLTRRASLTSLSSRTVVDKDEVSNALDDIHASASRFSGLTAFNDFAPPPSSASSTDRGFVGNLVPDSIGGIYARLKSSVGATKDRPSSSTSFRDRKRSSLGHELSLPPSPIIRPPTPGSMLMNVSTPARGVAPQARQPSAVADMNTAQLGPILPSSSETDSIASAYGSKPASAHADPYTGDFISTKYMVSDRGRLLDQARAANTKAALTAVPCVDETAMDDVPVPHTSKMDTELVQADPMPVSQSRISETVVPVSRTTSPVAKALPAKIHVSGTATPVPTDNLTGRPSALKKIAVPARPMLDVVDISTNGDISPSQSSINLSERLVVVEGAFPPVNTGKVMQEMRRKVLSKDFWMKDENAKACFSCGEIFTTFRRKHHCRTCGQIYDAKCTVLISGKLFGQDGKLRICKTCEHIIVGDDDSSNDSDTGGPLSASHTKTIRFSGIPIHESNLRNADEQSLPGITHSSTTPLHHAHSLRRKAMAGGGDGPAPLLSRPTSSRSLRSLAARPRSASYRQKKFRHQHMRSLGMIPDAGSPFQSQIRSDAHSMTLPNFHTDAVIDPDLAPYMSDEGTSDEEQPTIVAALHGEFNQQLTTVSKIRPRPSSSKGGGETASGLREADAVSIASSWQASRRRRPSRALSAASLVGRPDFHLRTPADEGRIGDALTDANLHANYLNHLRQSQMSLASESAGTTPNIDIPAPAAQLDTSHLKHVKLLLRQFFRDFEIPQSSRWVKVLVPMLLRCAEEVDPSIQRGDAIDIRHYVKFKKAPSGDPRDTSYVSGVVFTNNVALKSMVRKNPKARILIVSFPLIYARHKQHFMSLDPVIAQEREYLRNLARRIINLRPTVVLVQRQVAGLALEFLAKAGITVVCNVKESVLQAISRCTQTKIITSLDKLSMDPDRLGYCDMFEFKTFLYEGMKKTFAYVSGCQKDLGCTIVLRGADLQSLRNIKWITEFMCLTVYNLKLETSVIRDQFMAATAPSGAKPTWATNAARAQQQLKPSANPSMPPNKSPVGVTQACEASDQEYGTASGTTASESIEKEESVIPSATDATLLEYDELLKKLRSRVLSISPAVQLAEPYLLTKGREQEREMVKLRRSLVEIDSPGEEFKAVDGNDKFELVSIDMIHSKSQPKLPHVRRFLKAIRKAEYERSVASFAALHRRWETYVASSVDPLSPLSHQQIVVLFSIISTPSGNACEGPDLLGMSFYQEQDLGDGVEPDVPLGEYVERLCDQAHLSCSVARCDKRMMSHYRQYVHGDGQINVSVREYPAKLRGFENVMLMWSECRECHQETPAISMSSDTWKFSFAKYLELAFWSRPTQPRAGICPHDIYKSHTRYFGFNNLAVSIVYEPIRILEVIMPHGLIKWKVEKDLALKNEQFQRVKERVLRFMRSVSARIECIKPLNVKPESLEACKQELDVLRKRATDDQEVLLKKLEDKYSGSSFFEIVPLNRAVRAMQEKVASWDRTFADFEQKFLPSEKDIRRLAAQQLKQVYLTPDTALAPTDALEETKEKMDINSEPPTALAEHKTHLDLSEPSYGEKSEHRPEQQQLESHLASTSTDSREPATPSTSDTMGRHSIQHLDLAICGGNALSPERIGVTATPGELGQNLSVNTETTPNSCKPNDHVQAEHNSASFAVVGDLKVTGSNRPNPQDDNVIAPQDQKQHSPPPLLRSQTQPVPSFRRHHISSTVADTDLQESPAKSPRQSSIPLHAKTTYASRLKARESGQTNRITSAALKTGKSALQSMIPRSTPKRKPDSKVFALARHFEQMSREFERERLRDRRQRAARVRQAQVYSMASYQPQVELFDDATEAAQEPEMAVEHMPADGLDHTLAHDDIHEQDSNTVSDDRDVENASVNRLGEAILSEASTLPQSESPTDEEGAFSDTERTADTESDEVGEKLETGDLSPGAQLEFLDIPKHDKTSIMKMLTSFWSERSASGWTALEYPLGPTDHIFADSDIIVREDEPSSLIAFSLASQDYRAKLQKCRDQVQNQADANPAGEGTSVERTLLGETATHMKYQFQAGPARMQCKVFYAESFDAIRQVCGVADRFVESLSRCLKWDSRGGKTKSIFLKTLDDRFVIKSLSTVETQAFLRFAPDYFDYMSKCLFHKLPSALAKMLGFYQVIIKNPVTGIDYGFFFQVMENIFYEGASNRMFDLKGSMRNRKIQSTGERNEVLLDENLLDYISQAPVYVRNHSNSFLASSISNDTLFCSKQNVMDYSLIVGLYDERQELMVGIIDYIRTYTWDKKLESWIKDRGKNKPTVRSPKEYRNRFRASISRYFPLAPSCWQLAKPERSEQVPASWWDTLGNNNGSGHGKDAESC